MIEWREEGAVIAVRPHGETSVIAEVFTEGRGRLAGLVRGGTSRKTRAMLQPGAQVSVVWKARLESHLGNLTLEPLRSRAGQAMGDRLALEGLATVSALLSLSLPEREAYPGLYSRTVALLDLLGETDLWPLAYLQWELALLDATGFGLDLSRCAVSGTTEALDYVSPRTGRAVAREAAGEWADRLLPLPPVLRGAGSATGPEIARALATTGWFLEHRLMPDRPGRPALPPARGRLVELLARQK